MYYPLHHNWKLENKPIINERGTPEFWWIYKSFLVQFSEPSGGDSSDQKTIVDSVYLETVGKLYVHGWSFEEPTILAMLQWLL